jgi:monoterpene epsilon-lactone hydrolase
MTIIDPRKMAERFSLQVKRSLFSLLMQSTPTPRGIKIRKRSANGVPVAWIIPESSRSDELLFYLHGGGYTMGSIQTHFSFVSQLASRVGCTALLIDYRRAPEFPFPAALDDALTAYQWMLADKPGSRIVVAGESAGAGLLLSMLMSLPDQSEQPRACFLLSPWVDLAAKCGLSGKQSTGIASLEDTAMGQMAELYADGKNLCEPRISPLYGDLHGLPPMLIHAGSKEPLTSDAKKLAALACDHGVDVSLELYSGRIHALHSLIHVSKKANEYLDKAALYLVRRPAPLINSSTSSPASSSSTSSGVTGVSTPGYSPYCYPHLATYLPVNSVGAI